MRNLIRNKNFYIVLIIDAGLVVSAYFLAYLLRFEGEIPGVELVKLYTTLPYIVPFKLFVFMFFGLYKGMWRYTSFVDLFKVFKATITSSAVIILAILFVYQFQGFPRSVFILDWILTFIFIAGIRVAIRFFLSEKAVRGTYLFQNPFSRGKDAVTKKRLLIIGAGDAGEKMLREIRDNPRLNYEVVGFLDDDPKKKGMKIHGIPVLGSLPRIHDMAYRDEMDEILIATPSANAKQMRRIIEACEGTGLKSRTTPGIGELINGKISFNSIREVSYEDLLGRDPIELDIKSIGDYLKDRVILVTGAGGSIGSELCRQIAQFQPKNLILFDKTENSLFHIEMEFLQRFPKISVTPILGDVKYRNHLNKHFAQYRPQVVFHAAAHKHVPIVELNPSEAVYNNIIGTIFILDG
jgi:FlaA1/EpsC-like NDP-sugar epimerase